MERGSESGALHAQAAFELELELVEKVQLVEKVLTACTSWENAFPEP
jgi:hypothetical protein